jgi:DNA-binding response OmpR family regulator
MNATVVLAIRPGLHRTAHEAALAQRGFRVLAVNDCPQCLALLEDQLPDVLVLEAELPQGGGDGVLEVMHEQLESHRVPVFVLTTQRSRSAIYRIARFTISHFSLGPVTADDLADRVDGLVATRRAVSA